MEDESHLVTRATVSIQTFAWLVQTWQPGARRPGGHGQSNQQWDLRESQALQAPGTSSVDKSIRLGGFSDVFQ